MSVPQRSKELAGSGLRLRPVRPWQRRLPVLEGRRVTLREVALGDVAPLLEAFAPPETSLYITPPPSTRAGFERFVRWARGERRAGRYLCFAAVPRDVGRPIGVFQAWPVDPGFDVVEWGFAIGPAFWGKGVFAEGARLMIDFMFRTLGAQRLEARSAAANARGNAALRKLGAVDEGLLRRCFLCRGQRLDHIMWSLLAEEWRR